MVVQPAQLQIPRTEYKSRTAHLLKYIQNKEFTGVILTDTDYILYYTGFRFIPTERPMAFVMNEKGETGLFVPRLEREHAESHAVVDRIDHYKEYPDVPHPMVIFADILAGMGLEKDIAVDNDGYPWVFGYRGPRFSEMEFDIHPIRTLIEDQMSIKSEAEITLIRESARWANLAHHLLQKYTRVGISETEVTQRASSEATLAMLDTIGPIYRGQGHEFSSGAYATYRGQIGRNAAIPHSLSNNITFQPGDVLVTGATAPVWGYLAELERTMFMGEPTADQRHYFEHMLALQDLAINAIKPGITCSEVDTAVRAYFKVHDLVPYWKHHTGHTIGLRYHEGPFLDIGDETVIRPGLVFTVEPGLYVPGLGGFRHSDTVVVRGDGVEVLTFYPRDLESLIIPI